MAITNQQIQDTLNRVYAILKLTDAETKNAINDLAGIQQVAVATEMVKSLTEDEIKILNKAARGSDEEKKAAMERVAQVRKGDADFAAQAQAAAKKALDEHIAFLKTRGDDSQKAAIANILAEIV